MTPTEILALARAAAEMAMLVKDTIELWEQEDEPTETQKADLQARKESVDVNWKKALAALEQ